MSNQYLKSEQAKVKCYGSSAALTAEATFRSVKDSAHEPTLSLELAPKKGQSFDWSKKVAVQLSNAELSLFCSVLLGYLPSVTFKRKTKGVEVFRQPNQLYVRATQAASSVLNLPISIGDCYSLSALALTRLKEQSPSLEGELMIAGLKGAAALYKV